MSQQASRRLFGRVWTFGDDVDTDVMAPWTSLELPWAERRAVCLHIRPEFARDVQPGDVIVAGRNWGCGSSREQAPENLLRLGVAAVVAESFSRIYFRSAIAMAFPSIAAPGVRAAFEDGDGIDIDLEAGRLANRRTGQGIGFARYAPQMLEVIEAGGLIAQLRQRFAPAPDSA